LIFSNFNINKIIDDIKVTILKTNNIIKYEIGNENYYENFITFLSNSYVSINSYEIFRNIKHTMSISDFLKKIDLDKVYNLIHHYNIYITNLPQFNIHYLDTNKVSTQSYIVTQIYSVTSIKDDTEFTEINNITKSPNSTIFLYTIDEKNIFRYAICDTDTLKMFGFKGNRRLIKERKEKIKHLKEL
jgi:hypothetical protein